MIYVFLTCSRLQAATVFERHNIRFKQSFLFFAERNWVFGLSYRYPGILMTPKMTAAALEQALRYLHRMEHFRLHNSHRSFY